jgi:hypothetical protein
MTIDSLRRAAVTEAPPADAAQTPPGGDATTPDALRTGLRDYFRANVCPRHHLADELVEVWATAATEEIGATPASLSGDALSVADARVDLAALASEMRGRAIVACDGLVRLHIREALLRAGYVRHAEWQREGVLVSLRAERDRLQRACNEGLPREVIFCPVCQRQHVDGANGEEFRARPHHTHLCQFCNHLWDAGRWSFGVAGHSPNAHYPDVPSLALGAYRHYKGDLYDVEGVAHDSTNGGPDHRWLVLYRSRATGALCAREFGQFVEPVEREGRSVPRFERVEGAPASGFVSVLDLQLEAAEKEAASLSAKLDAVRQFAADMLHGPDCHARDHNDCGPVYCANGGTDEVCAKEQAACNCGVLRLRELLAGEARPTIPAEKGGA